MAAATEREGNTMPQVGRDQVERTLKEHPAKKGLVFDVAVTVLEIGGAIGLFHFAKGPGSGDVRAYLTLKAEPVPQRPGSDIDSVIRRDSA